MRPEITHASRPLTFAVPATDETGEQRTVEVAGEGPLTLYLDKREIVTLMTLGAAPEALAIGYLRNQRLIPSVDEIASVQVDWETDAVAVTTRHGSSYIEARLGKRTVTTGCGQGTVFGGLMDEIETVKLPQDAVLEEATLQALLENVRHHDSLYKKAGALHGCALAKGAEILYYVEDVGRHNAVDAIAGMMWLDGVDGSDKIFYTTGRLTSEMVIKTAQMGVPFLISRSGLTRMGWEIANKVGLTMIGRAQGRHYLLFTGAQRFRRMPPPAERPAVTGVMLAGGMGRRMGGIDKGLANFRGSPLAQHVLQRLAPQVNTVLINANRETGAYQQFGYPVVADNLEGFAGPLAGLQAGMLAAATPLVATVPCDSPFLPENLVEKLWLALSRNDVDLAVAKTGRQAHPVFCLCKTSLLPNLNAFLQNGGRKIDAWYAGLKYVEVPFDESPEAFANFNTPQELEAAA